MKMLTGFLPATEGWAKLFGRPMGSNDMEMRRNVGYMTQAFSLYGELTVPQNLELHAQLYHLPRDRVEGRIKELLERYDLKDVANAKPEVCRLASSNGCSSRSRYCTSRLFLFSTSRRQIQTPTCCHPAIQRCWPLTANGVDEAGTLAVLRDVWTERFSSAVAGHGS